ncbi:MAG: HEAT repeat domain-containing protein [Elusimicrobia bacterium]|nr:HEAT repeat domain-containing protein [Elusimicrobiota bacterium]
MLIFIVCLTWFSMVQAEEVNHYKKGVENYLQERYDQAITALKQAIEAGQEPEKANRLLQKVYLESIRANYRQKNVQAAKRYAQEALIEFPDDADLRNAVRILDETRPKKAMRSGLRLPKQGDSPRTNEDLTPLPRPAAKAGTPAEPVPAAAVEEKTRKNLSAPRWHIQSPWPYFIAIVVVFSAVGVFMIVMSIRKRLLDQMKKNQGIFIEQLETLKADLKEKDSEKIRLMKALEKAQAGDGVRSSGGEGVRSSFVTCLREVTNEDLTPSPLTPSPVKEVVNLPRRLEAISRRHVIAPSKSADPKRVEAQSQKKEIIDTLVKMTPEGRANSQKRILDQALSLYKTFPAEAVKFLGKLAHDEEPLVRANVIAALAGICDPQAVDILLELIKDADSDVKREVLKSLKKLFFETKNLPEETRKKIEGILREEIAKAEWVL